MTTRDDGLALETFLPYRLNRAAELVSRGFAELYSRQYGLSRPEWRCFATIGQFRRTTATRIGAHSSMHKTKVSRAVRALEERRWLKRVEDANDRRMEHLELTPLGTERYRELVALARAYEQQLQALFGTKGLKTVEEGMATIERALADPAMHGRP